MSGFLSILLLRGRLSRVPYGLIAVPILLLRLAGKWITYYAPVFFERGFHADLTNIAAYMMALYAVLFLLHVVLLIVSFNRLHDIGLTGFLALPYLYPLVVGVLTTVEILTHQADNHMLEQGLMWLARGVYWYGWGLALVLLVVPGRRKPPLAAQPVPAF